MFAYLNTHTYTHLHIGMGRMRKLLYYDIGKILKKNSEIFQEQEVSYKSEWIL